MPTPATTRVVQIEPGPTPTLIASAPASISAIARRNASSPTPTAAPTTRRPSASLVALGYWSDLVKSLTVIRPCSRPSSSTSGSFSILCAPMSFMASTPVVPTLPVTSGAFVMTSCTSRLWSVSNRRSRLVTMPISRPASSTTGRPLMRYFPHRASTSASVASGRTVTGWVIMPDSERLTRSTWDAWSATERLRCSTPAPPCRAIAIAIRASVTVSIAAETSGMFTVMLRLSRVRVRASPGARSEYPGTSRTSSKVSPSSANFSLKMSDADTDASQAAEEWDALQSNLGQRCPRTRSPHREDRASRASARPVRARGGRGSTDPCRRLRGPSLANEAPTETQRDRVGAVGRAELLEQTPRVGLDRVLGQEQVPADLGVRAAVAHPLEHLDLPGGEGGRGADLGRAQPARGQPPGRVGQRLGDGGAQLGARGVLVQVPAGARGDGQGDPVEVLGHGQHDHASGRIARDEPAYRLDPAEAGHPHVHEHQIGSVGGPAAQHLLPAARGRDPVDAGHGGDRA